MTVRRWRTAAQHATAQGQYRRNIRANNNERIMKIQSNHACSTETAKTSQFIQINTQEVTRKRQTNKQHTDLENIIFHPLMWFVQLYLMWCSQETAPNSWSQFAVKIFSFTQAR